jgi:hypothetical protein
MKNTSTPTLTSVADQKATWNEVLRDLCRHACCAIRPPGQPPSSARPFSVFSGVRLPHRVRDHGDDLWLDPVVEEPVPSTFSTICGL